MKHSPRIRILAGLLFLSSLFLLSVAGAEEAGAAASSGTLRGKLPAPVISMPASLRAGEEIALDIGEVPDAYRYEIDLSKILPDGDTHDYISASGAGRRVIVPFGAGPGSYTVSVRAIGIGFEASDSAQCAFTVTGQRSHLDNSVLTVPEGPYPRYSTVWAALNLEGLEGVEGARVMHGSTISGFYIAGGSSLKIPVFLNQNGALDSRIFVRINGCWSDPLRLSISSGDIADPGQPEDHHLGLHLPSGISLGEDLVFTIDLWDQADDYTYSLSYSGDGSGESYEVPFSPYENPMIPYENPLDPYEITYVPYEGTFTPHATGTVTIPSYFFSRAGVWKISVNAYRSSDNFVKYGSGSIRVKGGEHHPAPQILLTTEIPRPFEDVSFSITPAEDAEMISVMVKGASSENSHHYMIETNGRTAVPFTFNTNLPGMWFQTDYFISASACSGGLWSEYSPAIHIMLEPSGKLQDAAENCEIRVEPENPNAGDELVITWDPVPGAEWYEVRVGSVFVTEHTTETSVSWDTFRQDPADYSCHVFACAAGKLPAALYTQLRLRDPFWKPGLSVSKIQYRPGEDVHIQVSSFGGETIRLYGNGTLLGETKREDSGEQEMTISFPEPGIWRLTAEAVSQSPSVRSEISEDVLLVIRDLVFPDRVVRLPDSLTVIGDEAFRGIPDIEVHIPESVQSVSPTAFEPSVIIVAPEGSPAAEQCASYGLTVLFE